MQEEGDFGAGVADAAVEDLVQGAAPAAALIWLAVMLGELAGEEGGGAARGGLEAMMQVGEEGVRQWGAWGVCHFSGRYA